MVRIAYSSKTDYATITASSELSSDTPATNVAHDFLSRYWSSTGTSGAAVDEYLYFDFSSPQNLTCLFLFDHTLSANGTATLEAGSTTGYSDFSIVLTRTDHVLMAFFSETWQYWRVHFQDPPGGSGWIRIGRLFGGTYFEPSRNFRNHFRRKLIDPSESGEAESGERYWNIRKELWEITLEFHLLPESLQDSFENIFRTVGNHQPFVLSLDPQNHPAEWSHYVLLATPLEFAVQLLDRANFSLEFREMMRV